MSASGSVRCIAIADFNAGNLNSALAADPHAPRVEALKTPYGQVAQLLLDPALLPDPPPDAALVWTRPEAQLPTFGRLLDGESVDPDRAVAEVDDFVALVEGFQGRVRWTFVTTWALPPERRQYGLLDMTARWGTTRTLLRLNLRLAEALDAHPDIHLLDAERWVASAGPAAYNPKLWYMAKVPFAPRVFSEAAQSLKGALRALSGRSRRLLILDLDDTLWGGTVGETGWQGLRLGGHDPIGEAFVDFQRGLQALARRGVLLAIVSRNEEDTALEALRRHPEMVLREEAFAGWRIDWGDKAQNVAELVAELNLGLDSAVFIDNDPVQRARVREALPEVLVPEWPEDFTRYRWALDALACFDAPSLSEEDRSRPAIYAAERARSTARAAFGSPDDWLATLGLQVERCLLNDGDLPRACQLLNKTNQMNLSTRRLSEAELAAWAAEEGHQVWLFRVRDRFGDLGMCGLLGLQIREGGLHVVDFLLSCRVMGRRVEETMLATAVAAAREAEVPEVVARYLPTARNAPCLSFWRERSGFEAAGEDGVFRWNAQVGYPVPPVVELTTAPRAQVWHTRHGRDGQTVHT